MEGGKESFVKKICQPFNKAIKLPTGNFIRRKNSMLENNGTPVLQRRAILLEIPQTDGIYCIPQPCSFDLANQFQESDPVFLHVRE